MSSIKTFKLFPVPVFECQIENHELINTELEKYIYELKKNDSKGQSRSNVGGWHSPDFIIEDNVPVQSFIAKFNNLLPKIFINQMGIDKKLTNIKILNMWSMVNGKNTFNTKHNHPNSYFSAVYYIKINKDSGHIKFFDPKEVKTMYFKAVGKLNEFSTNILKIKPEEGKLLLFPSYLHHSVEENLSDEDRIAISFNLDIK
jgi:uncharacterized protein (TIGR02466 family)